MTEAERNNKARARRTGAAITLSAAVGLLAVSVGVDPTPAQAADKTMKADSAGKGALQNKAMRKADQHRSESGMEHARDAGALQTKVTRDADQIKIDGNALQNKMDRGGVQTKATREVK